MAGQDIPLKVKSSKEFTISDPKWSEYKKPAEKRRAIAKALNDYKFAITPERLSADRIGQGGVGKAVIAGVTRVLAFYDTSDNRGEIKHGRPVVFDMVSGMGVTGINPKWGPGEYKIVGKALNDCKVQNPQGTIIQIEIFDPPPPPDQVVAKAAVAQGDTYPNIQKWSEGDEQMYVYPFELPEVCNYDNTKPDKGLGEGATNWKGSGQFVYGYNTTRQYVVKGAFCLLDLAGTKDTQYYFEHWMFQQCLATLDAELKAGMDVLATIDSEWASGVEGTKIKVYDKMMQAGYRLKAGAKVMVSVLRHGTGEKPVWRFAVVQSVDCPDKPATPPP